MSLGLEPIESPLKQYIHEDMIDKRPNYKIKKKEKSEKQESKKPKLDPVMPSTKAPSFIQ